MKKETAEGIKSALPSLVTNVAGYLKSLVSLDQQKDTLTNASGTIGFFISLFGKPLIDKHYESLSKERLAEHGFYTYVKAAFEQTKAALEKVQSSAVIEADLPIVVLGLEKGFQSSIDLVEKGLTVTIFLPKYHPGVVLVRDSVAKTLSDIGLSETVVNLYLKYFNEHIEKTVESLFDSDYEVHIEENKALLLRENEAKLLIDQIQMVKVGFADNEALDYEETFGEWKSLSAKVVLETEYSKDQISGIEAGLQKVKTLIGQYFEIDPDNHLEKLSFIVADFGKGKSVFFRHYASELAKKYIETGDGDFPVYFNLRNFSSYTGDAQLGIIDDFLQTNYGIKVTSDYFKRKRYLFLIDSLDESCDLSKTAIDNVINSIKRIQNLDKEQVRTNKIIISSRYFEGLVNIIANNKPYLKKDGIKDVSQYISLYGFKKSQFNNWINNALKNIFDQNTAAVENKFIRSLIEEGKEGNLVDIHQLLISNKTLQSSELRRPIFAYMIYQLIRNEVDISQIGKIGVYLSFLNLLTKEAKYIHEPGIRSSLQEQFEARNILHQIAALWTYERQKGQQGFLKKADICRMMLGQDEVEQDDAAVIEKYRKKGGREIQFLSHSYFGENDNFLHFQHQSFAEILLAEYYVKVFIKCAFERVPSIDFMVARLKMGTPTSQTMQFFIEILQLLMDTLSDADTEALYEKRKLLVPLLASISISKNNNTLYSDRLFDKWYEEANIDSDTSEIPEMLVSKWCIDEKMIDKMVDLCEELIHNEKLSVMSKSQSDTALIDREVTYLKNTAFANSVFLERFIALVAGNILYNNKTRFFAGKIRWDWIVKMLKTEMPNWVKPMFKGIRHSVGDINLDNLEFEGYDLDGVDFSNSVLDTVSFGRGKFHDCNFSNTLFRNIIFFDSLFINCKFSDVTIEGYFSVEGLYGPGYRQIPYSILRKVDALSDSLDSAFFYKILKSKHFNRFEHELSEKTGLAYFQILVGSFAFYFIYGLKNKYISREDLVFAFPCDNGSAKYRDELLDYMARVALND